MDFERVGENALEPMAELARLRDLAAGLILFRCYVSCSDGSGSARFAFNGLEGLQQNPQGGPKLMASFCKAAFMVVAMTTFLALSGCAEMTQTEKDTATGAGIGAAAGAVIGGISSGGRGAAKGAAIGAAVGAAGGYIWSKNMQAQKKEMEQATKGTGIEVSQTADNQLKLEIPSDVSFDVGKADIKPEMRPVLDKFAQSLKTYSGTTIRIVGHTDSTGSDAINNPLSVNRAASTRDYLVRDGVAFNRISIDGRGSHEPVADNSTVQGRARNRRVDIFVAEPAPSGQQPSR